MLTSKYADNPEMTDIIRGFVTGLPARIKQMQEHLQAGDADKLLSQARQLKAMASGSGGCGFDPISDAAEALETALADSPNWEAAETAMSDLGNMTRRVKFTPPDA